MLMPYSTIHQATARPYWRILSLLRLGERRICVVKRALGMSDSAFSHGLAKLEALELVSVRRAGREKHAALSAKGRILFSSLQALCFMLKGTDGTSVEDDSALVQHLRVREDARLPQRTPDAARGGAGRAEAAWPGVRDTRG
jgi:DNA-binding transcriptional ArsR family regulator